MNRRASLILCLILCLLVISGIASASAGNWYKSVLTIDTDNLLDAETAAANFTMMAVFGDSATIEDGEPMHSCLAVSRPSVWFKYKANRDITVSFDTDGSNFTYPGEINPAILQDTIMTVYSLSTGTPQTAAFGNLSPVGCNDDVGPGTRFSRVTATLDAGTWYYIQITPYKSNPVPPSSIFRLNITATNLAENGDFHASVDEGWTLSGAGNADDNLICPVGGSSCALFMGHEAAGASKLIQVIDTFKGVKLLRGSWIILSSLSHLTGTAQNFKIRLTVVFADGTTKSVKADITAGRLGDDVILDTLPLVLNRPVAKIIIKFTDKAHEAGGALTVDDIVLSLTRPVESLKAASAAPLPLPVPPSAK